MRFAAIALALQEADHQTSKFRNEVLAGLGATPKRLPSRYAQDERGLRLLKRMYALPDYYLSRGELAILHAHGSDIAHLLGPEVLLLELAGGAGLYAEPLLQHLRLPAGYVPIHPAENYVRSAAAGLAQRFPAVQVLPLVADFTRGFEPPPPMHAPRRVVAYFPGSAIGKLERVEAVCLLRRIKRIVRPGGALLLGFDAKKEATVLERAYNDADGISAAFNRNVLVRINRELGGDFDPAGFAHRAFYNPAAGRIEMHLRSTKDQIASVGRRAFSFRRGESIHTENCYKYAPEEIAQMAAQSGFAVRCIWQDAERLFSLAYLTALAIHPN